MRMATHPLWNDDYWLLVLQLYLKRPTGVKAVYAREAVDLAVELHLRILAWLHQVTSLD